MILAVNPNTAIDRIIFVPKFELNRSIRASATVMGMGGKATDAAWILGELEVDTLVTGFAAGDAARLMVEMLESKGVRTDLIWVRGETRINTVIIAEDGAGQTTLSSDSLEVSEADIDAFEAAYSKYLEQTSCVIIGGSLPSQVPATMYTRWIRMARERDLPVVFDSSGEALKEGLKGQPTIVKPNEHELASLTGRPVLMLGDAYDGARQLSEAYGTVTIVTLGAKGALAVLPDRSYYVPPIRVESINTAGAGDGVLAGLALALSRGDPLEEGLRWGFAAAGAVVMTRATGDCRRANVEELLPMVNIQVYEPAASDQPQGI
jgi:1-phosphofructokinase family hexose kinase